MSCYTKERKRVNNPSAKTLKERQPPLTFWEGFKVWLNSWRLSSLQSQFKKEYARTTLNSKYVLQQIEDKVSGHR